MCSFSQASSCRMLPALQGPAGSACKQEAGHQHSRWLHSHVPPHERTDMPLQHGQAAHCAFCLASTTGRGQESRKLVWKQRLTCWPCCSAFSRRGKQGEPCWRRSSSCSPYTFPSCSEVPSQAEAAIWLCTCRGRAAGLPCCGTGCGCCATGVRQDLASRDGKAGVLHDLWAQSLP